MTMAGWLGATSSVIFRFLLRQRDCNGNGKPRGCVPQSLCLCSTPCSFFIHLPFCIRSLSHLVHQLLSPPHTVCEQGVRNRQTFLLFFFLLLVTFRFSQVLVVNVIETQPPPTPAVSCFVPSFFCMYIRQSRMYVRLSFCVSVLSIVFHGTTCKTSRIATYSTAPPPVRR